MKKRILHIAEASGGVERYLVTLLTKMKNYLEYDHVLVCSTTYDSCKFKGIVSAVEIIGSMHNAISFRYDSKAVLAVRKVIKKYKPDIVYCHSSKAGAIGRMADIGIKNILIYNAHGWSFNMKDICQKKIKLYETVEKILAVMTDKIVCISEHEKKSALEHGICRPDKLVVINNGIDFNEYTDTQPKSRKELGIPENAFVVGTVGRLTTQKAPDVFINMAEEIKKRIPEAFFLMVGDDISDGKFRRETEKLLKEAGLIECFHITGWIDNPIDFMGVFDAAVLLSRWEGFGLVLPEYMHMGKPIVATKIDAIPYVVGDAGMLVDVDDYKSAAESVIKLFKDNDFRSQLIEKGKRRVEFFNAQRTADEHKRLFDTLLEN